jgi:pimeloyl-ACP methyl ester carboxylesterase
MDYIHNIIVYSIGTSVWLCVGVIFFIIYIKIVVSSYVIMALPFSLPLIENNTPPNATAIHMTNLVAHYGFREETHDISGVKIHCVVKDAAAPIDPSGVLVFLHGTASSSATFFDTMKALPPTVKCVAIDLPTFGISGHIDIERYSTNEQLCIAYSDIIGHTLHQLEIVHQTILVAHSLGGFLSIYVADRFPIKKLVLLNPAGILPTLGEYGYYWAIFFKTGFPTKLFHLPLISPELLVRLGRMVFSDGGIKTDFWLSFFANPANEGHRILQRLITLTPFYSYWNTPAIMTLMDVYKKVPTSVCFGVDDTICPSHIGAFLSTLTRGEIMIHNIENANHNPCVNTGCMVKILVDLYDGNAPKRDKSWRKVAADNNKRKSRSLRDCRGYSYPLLGKTEESFQNVYDYIITNT